MRLRLSTHAVERARERGTVVPDPRSAVRISASLLRRLRHRQPELQTRGQVRYYATAGFVLLVVRKVLIVTCCTLELEDLAEILVDTMFRSSVGRQEAA